MSALGAMQEKNTTLEKNLSAETRVKLDLFSALGEAKRQLEIRESKTEYLNLSYLSFLNILFFCLAMMRNKDKEVLDLKAKIAQLLAVMPAMPNDSFCMTPCSTTGSSILRLNDTSSLQGPSSPMSHISLGGSPLMSLQSLGVYTSTTNPMVPTSSSIVPNTSNQSQLQQHQQQQQQQAQQQQQQQQVQQQQGAGSQLDPNATAYTPKNLVSGAEA